MKVIAHIHSDFPTKFGIPRQSGIVEELKATIVFEPEYRIPEAFRGLEDFSHIWLIWEFSEAVRDTWSPTVRPPRLGGNTRKGVFATRSPFRPNAIGLSSVKLEEIEYNTKLGPVLHVSGADLMDGTPIFDIKPYVPYTDSHPDATSGFAPIASEHPLEVIIPDGLLTLIPASQLESIKGILKNDPRPQYHHDPGRVYILPYAGLEISFRVADSTVEVTDIVSTMIP